MQRVLGPVLGAAVASGDGPWRAKTVHLALFVVMVGLGFWLHDAAKGPPLPARVGVTTLAHEAASGGGWDFARPVPGYVQVFASYIGGFFIGWALRRFLRLALAVGTLALLLVGLGKYAGWNTSPAETDVKERAVWVRHEATVTKDYLKGLLPSTSAAALGTLLGLRRRSKPVAPEAGRATY